MVYTGTWRKETDPIAEGYGRVKFIDLPSGRKLAVIDIDTTGVSMLYKDDVVSVPDKNRYLKVMANVSVTNKTAVRTIGELTTAP